MGSSEVIDHGIGKHREVQKPLLVTLHTDICLLRLLISSSTEYSLCPDINVMIINLPKQMGLFCISSSHTDCFNLMIINTQGSKSQISC